MTLTTAKEIFEKHNSEPFLLRHGYIVSGVLGWFAQKHDPQNVEHWKIVGLLHDIDFEKHPEQHCVKGIEILRAEGVSEEIIKNAMSHGWGMTDSPYQPELKMEKVLYAVDELTGLIGAAAIMRPSKSVCDIELSSVKKKFKDKKFAAGCSREVIKNGAELLETTLDDLIVDTIEAMRSLGSEMEI